MVLVASWRVKETERMIAICTELRKVSKVWCFMWLGYIASLSNVSSWFVCVELVGSISGRRSWLLYHYSPRKIECNSNWHIWWSQDGDGILFSCLCWCSCHDQGSRLHKKDFPWLLWCLGKIYKELNGTSQRDYNLKASVLYEQFFVLLQHKLVLPM